MSTPSLARESQVANNVGAPVLPLLASVHQHLSDLNDLAGREFLELGRALQSMSQRGKEVAGASHEVVELTATGNANTAVDTLQNLLADALRIQGLDQTSRNKLREVLSHADRSRAALGRLEALPLLLNTLKTLSRIEGGRLTSKAVNVSSLTEDMQRMAASIAQHVAAASDEAHTLVEVAFNSAQRLDAGEKTGQHVATDLIGDCRVLLDSFRQRSEASSAAAKKIDEEYAGVRRATDDLVMLLQFQDITRQRVEHVQEALTSAMSGEAARNSAESASILVLQRSQLAAIRDLLSSSLTSIVTSLQSLGSRLEGIIAETSALESQTGQDGRSFSTSTDRLTALGFILGQYFTSVRHLVKTVNAVIPALSKMDKAMLEIKEIQASVRLMSLNARIKTAQLAEDGEAMGAIAAQLHHATTQSDSDTKVVIESLTAMQAAVTAIAGHEALSAGSRVTSDSRDEVKQEVDSLLSAMVASSRKMPEMLTTIHESAARLTAELKGASEVAERSFAVIRALDEVLAKLDQGCEQLGVKNDTESTEATTAEKMSTLYSMHEERLVHQQVFRSGADKVAAAKEFADQQLAKPTPDSELGDNVELF